MEDEAEYVTLQDAARILGIGRQTLWRRMKAGKLRIYQSERDLRAKLVKRSDLDDMLRPRPIQGREEKAAA